MFDKPQIQLLTGDRLHLQHGPIDIVLRAWGVPEAVERGYRAVAERFSTILPELVGDLAMLRQPADPAMALASPVARRMLAAVLPYRADFITPMAAVAGSVAEELCALLRSETGIAKAYVNNGGDIALHLHEGEVLDIGIAGDFSGGPVPFINGAARISAADGIFGIATSGAQGRSFSLGIADSVTVFARDAAMADAAATIIANAVTCESSSVVRQPANMLDPDSDLGDRLVTVHIGALSEAEVTMALQAGLAKAQSLIGQGLILAAALMLKSQTRFCTHSPMLDWRHSHAA